MAATNLIPAQLAGRDFLCASHYSISNDDRFIPQSFKSTFHSDYLPPQENLKPPPARPPIPAKFMHTDSEKINKKVSETIHAYVEKDSEPPHSGDKYSSLYKTNFKMNSDAKIPTFQTMHDQYYKPQSILKTGGSDFGKDWTKTSIPQGDREKADEPISSYKDSYGVHVVANTVEQKSQHGFTNTIVGDNQQRFWTTHDLTYDGTVVKPASPVPKHTLSSVPEGDKEKIVEKTTTMKFSFQPNEEVSQSDEMSDSHTKIYATNFDLTDRHGRFDTYKSTQADSYQPLNVSGSRIKQDRDRNASDIPEGDLDGYRSHHRINSSVTRFYHKPYNVSEYEGSRVSGAEKRTASNVRLGENELASKLYDTTCDATYKAFDVPFTKADSHPKSVVPLKYFGDLQISPTTISDFSQHKSSAKFLRAALGNLQTTHFDQPLGDERYFTTSNELDYTPKQITKLLVDRGKLQRSSLPIGTLGKFIEGCNTGW